MFKLLKVRLILFLFVAICILCPLWVIYYIYQGGETTIALLLAASFIPALIISVIKYIRRPSDIVLGAAHQEAAMPLHKMIVLIFGFLALVCVGGGITGIIYEAKSDTKLDIFGAQLSTGHVGVAFVGLGLIIAYLTVRAVLRNQETLASLPADEDKRQPTRQRRQTRKSR
jgi:hypothetical protein